LRTRKKEAVVRTLLGSVLVLPILAFQASAQEIPRFSIEKICASAKALTSENKTHVETCVRDETAAHQQLHATLGDVQLATS
jgi:hypothetical protein